MKFILIRHHSSSQQDPQQLSSPPWLIYFFLSHYWAMLLGLIIYPQAPLSEHLMFRFKKNKIKRNLVWCMLYTCILVANSGELGHWETGRHYEPCLGMENNLHRSVLCRLNIYNSNFGQLMEPSCWSFCTTEILIFRKQERMFSWVYLKQLLGYFLLG